jgi:hypothetical protein
MNESIMEECNQPSTKSTSPATIRPLIGERFESRNLPGSPRLNESLDELHEKFPESPEQSEFLFH